MLRYLVQLECIVDNKLARFCVDNDTPLTVVKEMHFQIGNIIAQIENHVKAQQEQAKKEAEETTEEPKGEETNECQTKLAESNVS